MNPRYTTSARAYKIVAQIGLATSRDIVDGLNTNQRNATQALQRLNGLGWVQCMSYINPKTKGGRFKLWKALDWASLPVIKNTPKRENRPDGVTAEDLAWMQKQRNIAAARKARIAAINEVRGRV